MIEEYRQQFIRQMEGARVHQANGRRHLASEMLIHAENTAGAMRDLLRERGVARYCLHCGYQGDALLCPGGLVATAPVP